MNERCQGWSKIVSLEMSLILAIRNIPIYSLLAGLGFQRSRPRCSPAKQRRAVRAKPLKADRPSRLQRRTKKKLHKCQSLATRRSRRLRPLDGKANADSAAYYRKG